MGCCEGWMKYSLFFFNLVTSLLGLTTLIFGAILQFNLGNFDLFFSGSQSTPSIIIITAGGITFLISFLGCLGAIRESRCMLALYAGFLGLICATMIAGCIVGFLVLQNLDVNLREQMELRMTEYNTSESSADAWDQLQRKFKCCGIDGPDDWTVEPDSCKCDVGPARENDCNSEGFYEEGCYSDAYYFFKMLLIVVSSTAGALAIISLVAIIFSCLLTGCITSQRRKHPA